ncbi:aldo/keto reductase [Ruania alba]|uniref:D-threo-aldose 1-dehydrogenase n=1 Tax=Ruania alba TaxID=648782 RepID=A0A1H5HJX1_9MICO|nr:aldo/keto reductase [Ruania alba]SEE28326.1 D-threo-aldose 1-dehydrogenase [Ruania alba]
MTTTRAQVSRLELGCAWLGLPRSEPEVAHATIHAALDCGIRTFDVAPLYNAGAAESVLGEALTEVPRSQIRVSTKVGRRLRTGPDGVRAAVGDYTPSGVRRSLEESLERLHLERVDRLLLHDPQNTEDGGVAAYRELERMREEGLTDAIGIGINHHDYARPFVGENQLEVILLAGRWTLLDRSASEWLLPRCNDLGIGVAAAGVFNTGVLAEPDDPDARFDYAPASQQIRERARRIRQLCAAHGVSLPAAAIQYPFTDPAVTSVIIGANTAEQVRANTASAEHAVPEALWAALATQS